ncbi:MAG: hypothetical protein ACKOET_02845, partial [Verrucomicrobiota bacterium]
MFFTRFGGPNPIVSATIVAKRGSITLPIWSGSLSGASPVVTAPFTLPESANWKVIATVTDSTGRQAGRQLAPGGTPVVIRIRNPRQSVGWMAPGALAASRNDFSGYIGTRLDIGSQDIVVTHIGRWVLSGNTGTCTVKLFRVSDMAELGSATLDLSTGTPGGFLYGALTSPVTLVAGGAYYLMF